jgi:hypothetical protein
MNYVVLFSIFLPFVHSFIAAFTWQTIKGKPRAQYVVVFVSWLAVFVYFAINPNQKDYVYSPIFSVWSPFSVWFWWTGQHKVMWGGVKNFLCFVFRIFTNNRN